MSQIHPAATKKGCLQYVRNSPAYRLRMNRPGRRNESTRIAAMLDGSGTATRTLSRPKISSGDGSIALSSTQRSKRLDPAFQLPLNENDAFDTLVRPTVLGTIGWDDGPAPTGIRE